MSSSANEQRRASPTNVAAMDFLCYNYSIMRNEILPEPPQNIQSEADAQAARLVTEFLNGITERAHNANRQFRFNVATALVFLIPILALMPFTIRPDSMDFFLLLILSFSLLAPMGIRAYVVIKCEVPSYDWAEVAQMGGVRAIPPLFATLQNPLPREQKRAIRAALTTLLPQMKASDAHLLTPAARQIIHSCLKSNSDIPTTTDYLDGLCIASLKALEQVGDSSAIPFVERLTEFQTQTYLQEKIKQAAIECLPLLRANCGEVEAARTLLRASQSEDARPDTLLRPTSGAGQTVSQELLRGAKKP